MSPTQSKGFSTTRAEFMLASTILYYSLSIENFPNPVPAKKKVFWLATRLEMDLNCNSFASCLYDLTDLQKMVGHKWKDLVA